MKDFGRHLTTFVKAQLSAFAGYLCDWATMVMFLEFVFHNNTTNLTRGIAIGVGGIIGAVINFSLNKAWTFRTKGQPYKFNFTQQMWRFVFVAVGGICLKIAGTNALTNLTGINEYYCRLAMDGLVFVFFNYLLQRNWVFKKHR
jgi:putative flippase GtrA